MLYRFTVTPPRWLSDDGRKAVNEALTQHRPERPAESYPVFAPRSIELRADTIGSGFTGRRYLWLAHLPMIPPERAVDAEGRELQANGDGLPGRRVQAGDRWTVVDPWHGRSGVAAEELRRWRCDRCLVGYTFEPVALKRNPMGRDVWQPLTPWYDAPDG